LAVEPLWQNAHREIYRALCNVDQFRGNISSIIIF
jgi:hypothetical protein